jgi:FG-GAP-like repeat/Salmonella virulence plasmid 65kDa B protein
MTVDAIDVWSRATRRVGSACWRAVGLLIVGFGAPSVLAQLSVSDSGSPTYSHPIAVPPGVAGMSPKIGLFYAGGGVNGPVGHGWSIQGISTITRCPAIKAIDGARGAVTFTTADKLCLDGQRLIQTDAGGNALAAQTNDSLGGAGAAALREYRTEKDSYARIRAYGAASGDTTGASGPAYFKVWTKSGQIYEYGASPSADANTKALITPYAKTVAAVWAVSRISDTLGNYIDFKYEQRDPAWGSGGTLAAPTPGHEWNLIEIQYSGNKVVFAYMDRPDTAPTVRDRGEAWHQGSKNLSIRLLDSVTTYVNSPNISQLGPLAGPTGAVPVKTTKLGYGSRNVTGRSLLISIKDCAGDPALPATLKCLPATTFDYSQGGSEQYQANALFAASPLATAPMIKTTGDYTVLTGDFDGDGKTDILRLSNLQGENALWRSLGDGTFDTRLINLPAGSVSLNTQKMFSTDGCYNSVAADFNGDGLTDVLRTVQLTNTAGGACAADASLLFIGNGDGSFKPGVALTGISLSSAKETYSTTPGGGCLQAGQQPSATGCTNQKKTAGKAFYVLDVDGDGKLDIVTTVSPAYLIPGGGGDPIPTPDELCATTICTRVFTGSDAGTFTEKTATNLAHHSVYADPPAGRAYPAVFKANTVDVDGDGLTDLAVQKNGVWRSNGTSNGDFTRIGTYGSTCVNPIDFNGDGRADCLAVSSAGPAGNLLYTSTGATGTVATPRFNLTGAGQELTTPTGTTSALEMVALDINGDGRSDILRWGDNTTQNKLFMSNGDGTFTESQSFNLKDVGSTNAVNQLRKSDGSYDFVAGDFTGHGTTEILRMGPAITAGGTGNTLFTKTNFAPADQLTYVVSSSGAFTLLYYAPLTSPISPAPVPIPETSARYYSDRVASPANPNRAGPVPSVIDVTFPMYVVTTSMSDTGVGGYLVTEYSYLGLKASTDGRGLLGFREVRRQSPGPDPLGSALTVATQYLQTHPYIGVASRSDTRLGSVNAPSAQLLSTTVNAYCDLTSGGAAYTAALASAQAGTPNVFCATTAKVQRPYLLLTKEDGTDLGNLSANPPVQPTRLPTVTTQNTFQASGDPSMIVVTTKGNVAPLVDPFTKTTVNRYFPDVTSGDLWVLARLDNAKVTSTVPNVLGLLTPSAGTAPNATAIKGTAPLPPLSAAQLIPILELLLLD